MIEQVSSGPGRGDFTVSEAPSEVKLLRDGVASISMTNRALALGNKTKKQLKKNEWRT